MKKRFTSIFATLLASCFLMAVSFTDANAQATYCTPSPGSTSSSYAINTVKSLSGTANFNHANSGLAAGGYGDYYATYFVTQIQGGTFKLQGSAAANNLYWAVWIDWNQDGDFSDAGEEVYLSTAANANFTVNIFVPYSSTPGATRIRIIGASSSSDLTPCTTGSNLEAEDYKLNITAAPNCSGQPEAGNIKGSDSFSLCSGVPFSLSDTGATGAGNMIYQWQQRNPSGTGTWTDIAGANGFSLTLPSGITSSTDYRFYVVCNSSNQSDTSNVVSAILNAPTDCYCTPDFSGNYNYYFGYAYINSMQTTGGTVNVNNSGSGYNVMGYQDFRNTDTLRAMAGQIIALKPSLATTSTFPPTAGFRAWIDWNHDGDFTDAGENIVDIASQAITNSYNSGFTVPITAIPGHTTLRVMTIVYTDGFDPCGTSSGFYSWGEAEDYYVVIDSLPSCATGTFPTAVTASLDHDTLCITGDVSLDLDTAIYLSGITYQWQKASSATGPWTDVGTGLIAPPTTITGVSTNTWFRCEVKCSGTVSLTSNVVKTHVSNPTMASAPTSGTRCGPGTVALSASPSSGNSVNWYDQPTGGTPLAMNSNNYTTYYIPQTTVFYAAASGGTVTNKAFADDEHDVLSNVYSSNPLGMLYYGANKQQIIITAATMQSFGFNKAGYISSIGLDVLAAGNIDTLDFAVSIGTTSDNNLQSGWHPVTEVYHNTNFTPVANSINTFNFYTPFFWDGFSNIVVQFCVSTPANSPNVPTSDWQVRGNYSNYTSYTFLYYYNNVNNVSMCPTTSFYTSGYNPNVQFTMHELCESAREADTAFVTPGPDFSIAYDTVVCNGSVNNLHVSSTLSNYSSGYTWTALDSNMYLFTDITGTTPYVSGSNQSTIYFKSNVAGLHRIAVAASNGSGQGDCAAADTADIWVQPGNIVIMALPDTICGGSANPVSQMTLMPNTNYASGPYIQWQESANGSTYNNIISATNIDYTTVPLYTAHYYKAIVKAVDTVCATPTKTIVVANPTVMSTTDSSNCGPGTVTLKAVTGGNSQPIWYTSDTAMTSIGTGSPFVTPFLTETDTFYVAASGGAASVPAMTVIGLGATAMSPYTTLNPFYGSYGAKADQYMITKDELNAAGILGGPILSLALNISSGSSSFDNLAVSMKNVNSSALSASAFETGLLNVYGPQNTSISGPGWHTFDFSQPFYWDGTSSIVIQICWSNNGNYTNSLGIQADNTTYAATHYNYSYNTIDANDMCSHNVTSGYNYTANQRPQMQLGYLGPCETSRHAVIAQIYPKPDVDLGADINDCVDSGSSIILNAGVQPNSPEFLWNTGTTSQILSTMQSGTYAVTVTNSYDCVTSDTINVILRNNPKVTLPADTGACTTMPITLDAGPNGIQYFWNTGATTQTITVNTSGDYNVLVTNNAGCTVGDTTTVTLAGAAPSFDGIQITNDGYHTFKFNALNPQNFIGYDWNFGDGSPHESTDTPRHTYLTQGTYIVTLTSTSPCGSAIDSTSAHILGIGQINLDNNQLSVYPNPTKENATIETKGVKMEKIVIYNVLGQKIYQAAADSPYKHELDLKGIASGMYHISVYTDKGMVTRKLNVIK